VTKPDRAASEAFETATLRLVRERLAYINDLPDSRFTIESVRLDGSYPDTLLVVAIREYECGYGEDEYPLWKKEYGFRSPEEAAELIAAWVGENN
jgi:hypothetical protein